MEEQLFEAIKYIVNSEMEKTETQKFIKSQIVSGKQLDGSYYIEYQGLQMKAYPSSALSKYAQGVQNGHNRFVLRHQMAFALHHEP